MTEGEFLAREADDALYRAIDSITKKEFAETLKNHLAIDPEQVESFVEKMKDFKKKMDAQRGF